MEKEKKNSSINLKILQKNNTSESINKYLKTYAATVKKNIHSVIRSIYNYKMDQNQHKHSSELYAKRRPEELIAKYVKMKID